MQLFIRKWLPCGTQQHAWNRAVLELWWIVCTIYGYLKQFFFVYLFSLFQSHLPHPSMTYPAYKKERSLSNKHSLPLASTMWSPISKGSGSTPGTERSFRGRPNTLWVSTQWSSSKCLHCQLPPSRPPRCLFEKWMVFAYKERPQYFWKYLIKLNNDFIG